MSLALGKVLLQPDMLKQDLRARPHARIHLKALREERLERLGRALGHGRRTTFDDPVHHWRQKAKSREKTVNDC